MMDVLVNVGKWMCLSLLACSKPDSLQATCKHWRRTCTWTHFYTRSQRISKEKRVLLYYTKLTTNDSYLCFSWHTRSINNGPLCLDGCMNHAGSSLTSQIVWNVPQAKSIHSHRSSHISRPNEPAHDPVLLIVTAWKSMLHLSGSNQKMVMLQLHIWICFLFNFHWSVTFC